MKNFLLSIISLFSLSVTAQDAFKGTWQLSTYVDSVLMHKEIRKFSRNPASYCYQITIGQSEDEIDLTGYHEGGLIPVLERGKSWMKVGYDEEQFFTIRLIDNNTLAFKEGKLESAKNIHIDPNVHIFNKRPELPDLTSIFNKIVAGSYRLKNDEITISLNGEISGFEKFSKFELTIDFWDHAPGTFDSIRLIRNDRTFEYFKWTINNSTLIFTKLNRTVDEDSGDYEYELGTKTYQLEKK